MYMALAMVQMGMVTVGMATVFTIASRIISIHCTQAVIVLYILAHVVLNHRVIIRIDDSKPQIQLS